MLDNQIEFDVCSFYDGCTIKVNDKKEQELFDEIISQNNRSEQSKKTVLK